MKFVGGTYEVRVPGRSKGSVWWVFSSVHSLRLLKHLSRETDEEKLSHWQDWNFDSLNILTSDIIIKITGLFGGALWMSSMNKKNYYFLFSEPLKPLKYFCITDNTN